LAKVQRNAVPLKREALSFIEGMLLQRHVVPVDFIQSVAQLLDDLTTRSGIERDVLLTVGTSECLDPTTGVIRFRFTDTTIWTLPVLVHEFGHHAAQSLLNTDETIRYSARPIHSYLNTESMCERDSTDASKEERERALRWLHELFADVFATYALGAAYPLCVLALRACPDPIDEAPSTHPPWQRRVSTMVDALRAMSRLPANGHDVRRFALFANQVIELWRNSGVAEPPSGAARERMAKQAQEMVGLLTKHARPELRYPIDGPVETLVAMLADWDEEAPCPEGTAPTHVINAAWQWRLQNWQVEEWRTADLDRHALRLCARTL
jgi:hypothetical protein